MNPTPEQIKKINHFSKLPSKMCAKIAAVVNIAECNAKEKLLSEGERGDTMVLVFQGDFQSEVILLKYYLANEQKPFFHLEVVYLL